MKNIINRQLYKNRKYNADFSRQNKTGQDRQSEKGFISMNKKTPLISVILLFILMMTAGPLWAGRGVTLEGRAGTG